MSIINIDESKCVGCNSCVRVCPAEAANTARIGEDGRIIITINDDMCIKCGACIKACTHGARYFLDDTEEFMKDIEAGRETALIVAPAIKIAFKDDWADLLAYFRNKGVKFIYDVSFGADICTWVHVRYMEQNRNTKIISQPCAAIVNYVLKHNHDLVKYLSPGQSPMMCTAIYMRKYDGFSGKIAAVSPCIAKKDEFKQNDYIINYNVTLEKLKDYLDRNGMRYRGAAGGKGFEFDGPVGFVGAYYPQPGGLRENLKLHAPGLAVINSEGTERIYHELDQYVETKDQYRPPVFDVLNCQFGCDGGPALGIEYEPFRIASDAYDCMRDTGAARKNNLDKNGNDLQFMEFDKKLKLADFLRVYSPENTGYRKPTDCEIREGFRILHKSTDTECNFDCHACGYKSCKEMAGAVAKGMNVPENCRQYTLYMMNEDRQNLEKVNAEIAGINEELRDIIGELTASVSSVEAQVEDIKAGGHDGAESMTSIAEYMNELNQMTAGILDMMKTIDTNIESYSEMTDAVKSIAGRINLLSLNASIESARAGEAGRAFAVVAQNIRALSDSSKKSVETAQDSEDSIRSSINNVNATVEDFTKHFEKLVKQINDARNCIEGLSQNSIAISESMRGVADISEHLETIAGRATELLK